MKIKIISTFSDDYFERYSKHFVKSLKKNLDKNIDVVLYTDNVDIDLENIKSINLNESSPDLVSFKERNKHRTYSNFMFDGVTFAHKSYAIAHAGLTLKTDYMIWLDADSELISPINTEYLLSKIDQTAFTCYLGREGTYTETGFLSFNLSHPHSSTFFNNIKKYYDTDEIYNLPAYTDCHVFDAVRLNMEEDNLIKSTNVSPKNVKHHFNEYFKDYIIHLKGKKKIDRDRYLKKAGVKE